MSRSARRWVLGSAMMFGVALVAGVVSSAEAGGVRQRWEYHCALPPGAQAKPPPGSDDAEHGHEGHHPSEKVLNHLGDQGWELVAIDPQNHHYCFKRPR